MLCGNTHTLLGASCDNTDPQFMDKYPGHTQDGGPGHCRGLGWSHGHLLQRKKLSGPRGVTRWRSQGALSSIIRRNTELYRTHREGEAARFHIYSRWSLFFRVREAGEKAQSVPEDKRKGSFVPKIPRLSPSP